MAMAKVGIAVIVGSITCSGPVRAEASEDGRYDSELLELISATDSSLVLAEESEDGRNDSELLEVISVADPNPAPPEVREQSRNDSGRLEEIVVTAQKREQSARDIPIAIQAFSGDTLRELGIVNTRDLAVVVPGFSYSDSGYDQPIYTLRGVGFADSSRTANSAVGLYVDEVAIPYAYMTQGSNVDIERLEVLKGPQGTLYGRNTTGGAINFIANKPTQSLEFGMQADYGSFDHYAVEAYLSGPVGDSLAGRIAWRTDQSGKGWQESVTRPDDHLGEQDKQSGRAMVEWTPASTPLRVSLSLDWWRDQSQPQAPQAVGFLAQNQLGLLNPQVSTHPLASEDNREADWAPGIDWRKNNEMVMPALRTYWDITDTLSLTVIAAYSKFETDHGSTPLSGLSVVNSEMEDRVSKTEARSIEVRAAGLGFDQRLSWMLGVYHTEDEVADTQKLFFTTSSAVFNLVPGVRPLADRVETVGRQDADSDAVFASGDLSLGDQFELSLGVRYTEDRKAFAGCTRESLQHGGIAGFAPLFNIRSIAGGGSGGAGPGDCLTLDEETRDPGLVENNLEESSVGGKVAMTWRPSYEAMFYTSYSRGFKSGSFPIVGATEGRQFDPVTQEQLDAIELGGKLSWFNDSLRTDFALFDYNYRDKQLSSFFIDPIFGPLFRLFNVPKAQVRGAELKVDASPLRGLFVSLAATYLDTELGDFAGTTRDGQQNVDFSGNELPFAPRYSVSMLVNYKFPLPFTSRLEGRLGIDGSYNADAKAVIEDNDVYDIKAYQLWGVRAGIGDLDEVWSVTAWARNVTDEYYQLSLPLTTADTQVRFTGMPRTYGLSVQYRFY